MAVCRRRRALLAVCDSRLLDAFSLSTGACAGALIFAGTCVGAISPFPAISIARTCSVIFLGAQQATMAASAGIRAGWEACVWRC